MDNDKVVKFLEDELSKEETTLAEMERKIEPQREKVRRLRASLAAQKIGSFGSATVTDDDIIVYVDKYATAQEPLTSTEIAQGMNLDTRGLSRRLPRMVNDGLLEGTPVKGYWPKKR